MSVAVWFNGHRLGIKIEDNPILFHACSEEVFNSVVDKYEGKGYKIIYCDSEKELEKTEDSWF